MSITGFNELVKLIGPGIAKEDTNLRLSIPVEERLSVTISTCEQIWNMLQPLYMPTKQGDDWIKIADEFYSCTNISNIIGAIDGKHIRMIQPEHSGSSYFNYKKFFSCVLMALTDADYKFVYIDVGSYGTASDSEIFKTSEMGKRLSFWKAIA
nr:uncharacterized protein LOC113392584 [Vanessa tameamea]